MSCSQCMSTCMCVIVQQMCLNHAILFEGFHGCDCILLFPLAPKCLHVLVMLTDTFIPLCCCCIAFDLMQLAFFVDINLCMR